MGRDLGNPNTQSPASEPPDERLERLLDQALEATFPASDPIAVSPPPEER